MKRNKKLYLVLVASVTLVLMYGILNALLMGLASWAESRYHHYPWKDEDYLRFLAPNSFKGVNQILLAGPSEAREAFLVEQFNHRFPKIHAFQGGLSLGTMEDLLLYLEYLEKSYGEKSIPNILVLGITPRFVANIPKNRPFKKAIDRYSPYWQVQQQKEGSVLVKKTLLDSWCSWMQCLLKQQKRYAAAVWAVFYHALTDNEKPNSRDMPVQKSVTEALPQILQDKLAGSSLSRYNYLSPYRYHHLPPWREEEVNRWMNHPSSFWYKIHRWNPAIDSVMVQKQFQKLLKFASKWHIQVCIVNLPERKENRLGYQAAYYEKYRQLVKTSIGNTPYLELRDMLKAEAFFDIGHVTLPGAIQVTRRVIDFMVRQSVMRKHPTYSRK